MSKHQRKEPEPEPKPLGPLPPADCALLVFSQEELFLLLSCLVNDKVAIQPLLKAMVENTEDAMEDREVLGYAVKKKIRSALMNLQNAQKEGKVG